MTETYKGNGFRSKSELIFEDHGGKIFAWHLLGLKLNHECVQRSTNSDYAKVRLLKDQTILPGRPMGYWKQNSSLKTSRRQNTLQMQ